MVDAKLKPPRGTRVSVAVGVGLLHLIMIALLVRGFAPGIGDAAIRPGLEAFNVVIEQPREPRSPASPPPGEQGAAAPAGRKAQPREVAVPRAKVEITATPAPPTAGKGAADTAGAVAAGAGIGAWGAGQGVGSGIAGAGWGGGGSAEAIKIAGDIVSARDYPRKTRELRLGSAVTILLTVGGDGRVSGCRVLRASRDPEADRITCRLATERFRFRPARDAAGRPVEASYGWQQRWFMPDRD